MKIFYNDLLEFTDKILSTIGLDEHSVKSVSLGLCDASLRGVDSHGIRLLPHYVKSAISGRKNPKPSYRFFKKFPCVGVLDADNAFGHAAGMKAIYLCEKIATENGIGLVSVINSSHSGSMAGMALKGAKKGFITFAFTHADSLMLSHNGKKPYFGTNPICMAAPRENDEPYCLDMATTMISWNKLMNFKDNNISIKDNLAADSEGNATTNLDLASSLLPIGDYKGFGLASMVEVLCGVFTGMSFGTSIPPMYTSSMKKTRNLGQVYLLLRVDGCIEKELFLKRLKQMTEEVRNQPSNNKNGVMLPNDPEIKFSKEILKNGIPVDNKIYEELKNLSDNYQIKLNFR